LPRQFAARLSWSHPCEVYLSCELEIGKCELCLLVSNLRLLVEQLGTITVDFGLVDRGVDLGQELPLLDNIPYLHKQLFQLPRDLCADIHELLGLERAGRSDRILDVATCDYCSQKAACGAVFREPRLPCEIAATRQHRTCGKNERQSA
jgi:hypothetical protein